MADNGARTDFGESVTNIRETVKWILASCGAVFVTLLAGVQFAKIDFAGHHVKILLGAAAIACIALVFRLAVRTLVIPGFSYEEFQTSVRLAPHRANVAKIYNTKADPGRFDAFTSAFAEAEQDLVDGKIDEDDPYYAHLRLIASDLLGIAKLDLIKARYDRMLDGLIVLMPFELILVAALVASGGDTAETAPTVVVNIGGAASRPVDAPAPPLRPCRPDRTAHGAVPGRTAPPATGSCDPVSDARS